MPLPWLDLWLNRAMDREGADAPPTAAEFTRWQLARLRETLAWAKAHSPFYASRLAGIDPAVLRAPADLTRLPRTGADDLRLTPDAFLCVSRDEVAQPVTLSSSGSSGPPKRLFFGADDLERTCEFFNYGMRNLAAPGQNVLVLLPGAREGGVGRLLADALARFGARGVLPEPGAGPGEALELALAEDARVVVGAPTHVQALAALWAARGLPSGRIHTVLLCWDMVPRTLKDNVRRLLGCRVLTHWGMTETGLGGAVDCAEDSGMHVRGADLFIEITDPATGHAVPPGRPGEIVVSTLSRRAMPLIRYRTGDMARLLPGTCACGSPLPRLDRLAGRLGQGLTLYSGEVLDLGELDEALFAVPGLADFRAELVPGRPLTLRLAVVHHGGSGTLEAVRQAALGVEAVRRACADGALGLTVVAVPGAPLEFHKRSIRFRRNEAACP